MIYALTLSFVVISINLSQLLTYASIVHPCFLEKIESISFIFQLLDVRGGKRNCKYNGQGATINTLRSPQLGITCAIGLKTHR